MKTNIFFFVAFFSNILIISSNYTYEIIKELIPKVITFDAQHLNYFKIFKYIPPCLETENYKKDIYLQVLTSLRRIHYIYIYDNFSNIAQNSDFHFINYINYTNTTSFSPTVSYLFSNLDCKKEYFFVILLPHKDKNTYYIYPYQTLSGLLFNIIDANNNIINLSPELSYNFSFYQRNEAKKEIIFYSHNETKNAIIYFSKDANIQIFKNGEIVYFKREKEYKKEITFLKNENYTIHFMGYEKEKLFTLQLFNETSILEYDFNSSPIALYGSPVYYFEINISQFEINDIILLDFYNYYSYSSYSFKYQYKSKFVRNNFINLGRFREHNYIPIRNKIKDSSLIISIENYNGNLDFSILNLIPDKIEEIYSELKQEIKGPKYYFIDYSKFNDMNSIGFLANESFLLFEENIKDETTISNNYYHVFITTLNNYDVNTFKSAIINFNSSNYTLFEIKKYNYPFLYRDRKININYEYFQLCQGDNTLDEIYFYLDDYDIFQPIFGTFDSYFIEEKNVINSSSLDFDNKELKNYYKINSAKGFLKIKCKAPLMLKHMFIYQGILSFTEHELNCGQKYYLAIGFSYKELTFEKSLINKDLQIKITIFGLEPEQFINLYFNYKTYYLTNESFLLNFTYEYYTPNLFHFIRMDQDRDRPIIGEINIGLLPENITKSIRKIDFNDSLGNLEIKGKEIIIIKIPQKLTTDFFDFSIYLQDSSLYHLYIDISYDIFEFQTIYYKHAKNGPPSIPLFKINPYNYIESNLLSNNKYFYILLFGYEDYSSKTIYIRRPKIFSDVKINTINYLPELKEDNKKYYYQIEYPKPKGNNSYLLIQIMRNSKNCELLSKQNIQYFLNKYIYYSTLYYYYIIPLYERKNNNFDYINFYTEYSGYINFIQTNELVYPYKKSITGEFIKNIQQINGENKLKIELASLSYLYSKEIVKYYILINYYIKQNSDYYIIVIGERKPDVERHEFMEIIEDNGINDTISKEISINIEIYNDTNKILIIPILKNKNLIIDEYIDNKEFNYTNVYSPKKNNILWYILIPSIAVIIIIIVIIIVIVHKKRANKEIAMDKVTNEGLINNEK